MISTIEDSENQQEKLDKELLTICSLLSNPTQALYLEQLIAKGADVNVKIKNDDNLLISLIKNGKIHFAQALIKNGAELVKDEDGRTPLMHASKNGHAEIVKQLLQKDSSTLDGGDRKCQTALMFASQGGFNDVVGVLTEYRADVNLIREKGDTALMRASKYGHLAVAQALINAKANVNDANEGGRGAIDLALKYTDVTNLLIENGAVKKNPSTSTKTELSRVEAVANSDSVKKQL